VKSQLETAPKSEDKSLIEMKKNKKPMKDPEKTVGTGKVNITALGRKGLV